MTFTSQTRSLKLAAVASLLCLGVNTHVAASAEKPQQDSTNSLSDAVGVYDLEDGRELVVRLRGTDALVSIDNQRSELWLPAGVDVLTSPDRKQVLRLQRNPDGSVTRVQLEKPASR